MPTKNKQVTLKNLGRLPYQAAWDLQEELLNEIVAIKIENRKLSAAQQKPTPNYLLLCEHPHVYTLGRTGSATHLLASKEALKRQGISFYATNRGGDITYHGPGQLVVYPILDLENFFMDLHRYLRLLEQAVMAMLEDVGLVGKRIDGLTGVWIDDKEEGAARKLCAIGVRTSRWVTMHGLALNVNTDLSYFEQIVPCGLQGKKATSMAQCLGGEQEMAVVAQELVRHMVRLFVMEEEQGASLAATS